MKKTFVAAKTGHIDSQGDVFLPGSFKMGKNIVLSHGFNPSRIIGFVEDCKEVGDELRVTADVPEELQHLVPAIGFKVIHQTKNQDGTRTIQELRLLQVSLVPHNINPEIKPLKDQ